MSGCFDSSSVAYAPSDSLSKTGLTGHRYAALKGPLFHGCSAGPEQNCPASRELKTVIAKIAKIAGIAKLKSKSQNLITDDTDQED